MLLRAARGVLFHCTSTAQLFFFLSAGGAVDASLSAKRQSCLVASLATWYAKGHLWLYCWARAGELPAFRFRWSSEFASSTSAKGRFWPSEASPRSVHG